jgi:hypothetical protein
MKIIPSGVSFQTNKPSTYEFLKYSEFDLRISDSDDRKIDIESQTERKTSDELISFVLEEIIHLVA